jgi:hypothetical protein
MANDNKPGVLQPMALERQISTIETDRPGSPSTWVSGTRNPGYHDSGRVDLKTPTIPIRAMQASGGGSDIYISGS